MSTLPFILIKILKRFCVQELKSDLCRFTFMSPAWSDLQSDLFEYQDFQSEKTSGMLFLYRISNANTQCIVIANPDEPLGGARELIAVSRLKVFHPREVFPQIILPSDTFSLILQPSLQ